MSSSKLRKISKIVKEISMQSSQSTYDISGLDLSLCKFYYRTPQNLFKDLASGDYTIDTSSGQQSLVIQNDTVLQTGEAIQVCYSMDLTSSKYVVDFEVDVNRLTTSYNELVEDVHTLWEYIRKTGMIADDTTIDLILPQLNNNEVWVKSEDGYKGMPLDDVEQSVKDIIDKYSQQKIEEIKREVTTHVDSEIQRATNEITDVKDTSIQNIKDQEETSTNNMISGINKHTEKKKVELNDHEQLKEQELNDLHEQLSTRLQELIDGAVMDKGVLPINSDWHLLDRGNYYVIDLFNSNYKNHPINIVNQNEGQGIVMVGIADDGKTKIIRYYSTSKRMFFQVLTQSNVWSEWAVIGGGHGTVYEIVQNNHGFNFNAVSLDGLTSRWVLADKNTGADAIAIKIDDNRFQLFFSGQGVIPTSSRDDKGNEFIYDEYYFLSNTVNGAFQKDKPTYGLFQPLFHTRMVENKLVADVQIGDIHDLTQHIVDSETIKEYGIATEKDLLNKLDKGNVSSNYNTAEKIEYQIKKLQANTIEDLIAMNFLKVGDIVEVLGYYTAGDGAGHKRIIANEDDGSGVQLSNRLWANIVHNGEVNVSWFGAKGDNLYNNTDIFNNLSKYINNIGGNIKIIFGSKENIYIVGKQWENEDKSNSYYGYIENIFDFEKDVSNIEFDFNFCTIKIKEGLRYGAFNKLTGQAEDNDDFKTLVGVGNLIFFWGKNLKISNLNFDGSSETTIVGGRAKGSIQAAGRLLRAYDCTGVIEINNVISSNACLDHFSVRLKTLESDTEIKNIYSIKNCILNICGRNGITLGGCDSFLIDNVIIKNSGKSKVSNSPKAGIDMEPETSGYIRSGYINNVSIVNSENYGIACNYAEVKNITINNTYISQLNSGYALYFNKSINIKVKNSTIIGRIFKFCSSDSKKPNIIDNCIITNKIKTYKRYGEEAEINYLFPNDYIVQYVDILKNCTVDVEGDIRLFYRLNEFKDGIIQITGNVPLAHYGIPDALIGDIRIISDEIHKNKLFLYINKFSKNTEKCHIIFENNINTGFGMLNNSLVFNNLNCQIRYTNKKDGDLEANTGDILFYNSKTEAKIFFCTKGGSNNIGTITYTATENSNKITVSRQPRFINYIGTDIGLDEFNIIDYDFYTGIATINKTSKISGEFTLKTTLPEYIVFSQSLTQQLNTPYMATKMKQENVYDDYIAYNDEKFAYDKQQKKLEQDRQLAYEEALKENPNLTYEEFRSVQPMTLNLMEEPQPSENLKKFMDKYL